MAKKPKPLHKIKPTQFTFSGGTQITNEFTKEIWKEALNFKSFRSKLSNRQWQQIVKDLNMLNNIIAKNPKIRELVSNVIQSQKSSANVVENLNEIVIQNYDKILDLTMPLQELELYIILWKKIQLYKLNTQINPLTTKEWEEYNKIAGTGNEIQSRVLDKFTKEELQSWLEKRGFANDWSIIP